MYSIQYACVNDIGKIRLKNQDNIVCRGRYLSMGGEKGFSPIFGKKYLKNDMLFGVFDGLGGEPRGEVASYMAAKAAAEWEKTSERGTMTDLCLDINKQICEYTKQEKLSACGTTAAMLLFDRYSVEGCNLGDSRIYQYRDQVLKQMSKDHVFSNQGKGKPPLLQFLGIPETEMILEPKIFHQIIKPDDIYMICSDGLTDMLTEEQMREVLRDSKSIYKAIGNLLGEALNAGGRDNISIILVKICGKSEDS